MAVLQNMREKFGIVISVIIALSLLYFIAPMDDLMTLFGKPQNVGEIAGTSISYEDFAAEVENYTQINELLSGSSAQNEESQKQIRDAAWQSLLDRYMFLKNCEAAGIKVSDAEVRELFKGEHVSPLVAQSGYFMDENGNFSAERVRAFEQAAQDDPNTKLFMDYLKNNVKKQQFYSKYYSLFVYSNVQNPQALSEAVAEGNTTADVDYVVVNYGFQRDSSIKVSSNDIRAYYNAHKQDYKRIESRDVEYVVYQVEPSQDDFVKANNEIEKAYAGFAGAENLKSFILKNSDKTYSEYWYKKGELKTLSEDLDSYIFSGATTPSPIYLEGETYVAGKTIATKNIPDSVYVKHILLQGENEDKADSLLNVVTRRPASFAAVAEVYSADKGSKDNGTIGNIGWMTQTYTIPGFESVMTAKTGEPYVIDTQYGKHIVVVEKTTKPVLKKQVALLTKDVIASKETFNNEYAKANKFSGICGGTYEGYLAAVDSLNIYSHAQNGVYESTERFGSIESAKELTRWIYDAKKGKASGIITINNEYFVIAALKDVHKAGYIPVEEVASSIEYFLYLDKYHASETAKVAAKIEGLNSLDAIAAALGTEVKTQEGVTFSAASGSALEPAVLGAILKTEVGAVSGAVKGQTGTYVVKVNNKETGSFYTEEDAKAFAMQKANYESQMLISEMAKGADVTDNRARFF